MAVYKITKVPCNKGIHMWRDSPHPFLGKKRGKQSLEWIVKRTSKNIGSKRSIKTCLKISESHKGEKNPGWKGGISTLNYRIRHSRDFSLWREAVFNRDDFSCRKCKKIGGNLHPHHILNFSSHPQLRFAIDNGITLCASCHKTFHKKFGTRNNTLEQLNEFLKNE